MWFLRQTGLIGITVPRPSRLRDAATITFSIIALGKANVVLVGPNGVGKSMLAKNVAHQALIHGKTVRFTTAGELLGDLAALDSDMALRRRLFVEWVAECAWNRWQNHRGICNYCAPE